MSLSTANTINDMRVVLNQILLDGTPPIGNLSDVDVTGISDGDILVWNTADGTFKAGTLSLANGATGRVQISGGSGVFSSSANLTFISDVLSVPGLAANTANVASFTANTGNVGSFTANTGHVASFTANTGNVVALTANTANVASFTANTGHVVALTANTGNVVALTANTGHVASLTANTGNVVAFTANTGNVVALTANTANVGSLTANTANVVALEAGDIIESSSKRYKKNIKSIENSLDMILKLNPVSFKWKYDDKFDYGLIAEDVITVIPEMAKNNVDGLVDGVRYSKLVTFLIGSIKTLNDRIIQLEKNEKI